MIILTNEDLKKVVGGISFSGSLVKAFTSFINTIMEVGRSFGTAIRRIKNKNICSM